MQILFRKKYFKMGSTRTYCKTELSMSFAFMAVVTVASIIIDFGGFFNNSRKNVLPLQYYILGLPVDRRISLNLLINFGYQLFSQLIVLIFFIAYAPMTIILMNHLCWRCDFAFELIEELEFFLKAAGSGLIYRNYSEMFEEKLRKVINATYDIIEWQKQAQDLLVLSFLAEFSLLSVMLCMSVTSITSTLSDLVTAVPALLICTSQLFVYCWLGSRVKTRFDLLSNSLFGVNWERLHSHQRQDLKLILQMCQNLKSFNGIFDSVDLTTFKKVCIRF